MTAPSRVPPQALLALMFAVAVAFYWCGLGPGDELHYLEAALRWQEGAWLGDTHWALRHLFVLPTAAFFKLFGFGEFTATLTNILYAAMTVALTWTFGRRWLGEREALIAAALIATSAFFVARPIELDVYGAEAFFAALSCWLFIAARDSAQRSAFLVAAGVAAGLAWTVREQAVYLIAAFAALLLHERRRVILSTVLVSAGFAAVIALELVLYAVAAGDPLHRYRIDLGHRDIGVNTYMTPERAKLSARAARLARYLVTTPAVTPMLILAAAGAAYLRRTRALAPNTPQTALLVFSTVAGISAIVVPIAFNLSALRYMPMIGYAAFLIVAAAIARLYALGRPRAAAAAILAVIGINLAAADFTRDGDYAEARALAHLAKSSAEPIYADPLSVSRARYQLRLAGWQAADSSEKVRNAREAAAGALLFKTERLKAPEEPVCIVSAFTARKTGWTHSVLRETGLAKLLGPRAEAIAARPAPVLLIRLLNEAAPVDPISRKPCLESATQP